VQWQLNDEAKPGSVPTICYEMAGDFGCDMVRGRRMDSKVLQHRAALLQARSRATERRLRKELSSGGDRSPSKARPYELLGICEHGIDYLHQPVYCDATNITPHGRSVEFDERCTTKGHYNDEFHSRITVMGHRAILLSRTPTKTGGGYSPSPKLRYIRCNQTNSWKR
jgi:hypothetical protein